MKNKNNRHTIIMKFYHYIIILKNQTLVFKCRWSERFKHIKLQLHYKHNIYKNYFQILTTWRFIVQRMWLNLKNNKKLLQAS